MDTRKVCKMFCLPVLLLLAFYLGGIAALASEVYSQSLLMSCGVFTAVFTAVIGLGAKIYHILFL